MNIQELGLWGESFARSFLQKKGYHILESNVRFKKAEIDIIAKSNNQLVVVEVKTRNTAEIGEPWRAVTKKKQRQIVSVANHYVTQKQIDLDVRFDIVSIVHNSYRTDIEHIVDAFYPLL
jgi:putative endonuclease